MPTDLVNALVDTYILVPSYSAISDIPETRLGPPTPHEILNSLYSLRYLQIDYYTILIAIWMTSSKQYRGNQIANTESLMEQSVPSCSSSRHYRGSSKTP